MTSEELTNSQISVLERLPDTRNSIAEDLDITSRSVRYRMEALEDKGYTFSMGSDYVWRIESRPEEEPERTNTYHRSTVKKELNNVLVEIERDIKELVNSSPPTVSEVTDGGEATLVIPHSDSHIGAEVDGRNGEGSYSSDVAVDRISDHVDQSIHRARERGDVEHVEYVLMGDIVDGEDIYPNHNLSLRDTLQEQIRIATGTLLDQIKKLSDEFETVGVRCIGGNHGRISKNSTSNADSILYDFLDVAVSNDDSLDNVMFQKSTNGQYVNFDVRGHTFHVRHGQDSLSHIGTSSGKRRWLEWKDVYRFDVGLRGHYHTVKREPVGRGVPIFQTGSPCPPSLFAESLGESGVPSGMYLFVTDDVVDEEMRMVYY